MAAALADTATSSTRSDIMLDVRNLYCERDERILFQDLNFQLRAGAVLQVQGSNGSGKTTLLRILCGLNDNYRGAIYWKGEELADSEHDFLSSLLYIGHRAGVSKVLSPMENLRWTCRLQQQLSDAELVRALAEVGLRGYEDSPCYTLSAGQQQRVALARLLVTSAKLWVLDEPFTTLDSSGIKQLETLLRLHAESNGAVLVTTHHQLNLPNLEQLSLG